MSHLVINRKCTAIIPPVVLWYVEGWNGFVFKVSTNETIVVDTGPTRKGSYTWRDRVLVDQAWRIAMRIEDTINAHYDSLSVAIDTWTEIGYVLWVEDVPLMDVTEGDPQPDDYINPELVMQNEFWKDH
jgi:hypothetical protein